MRNVFCRALQIARITKINYFQEYHYDDFIRKPFVEVFFDVQFLTKILKFNLPSNFSRNQYQKLDKTVGKLEILLRNPETFIALPELSLG